MRVPAATFSALLVFVCCATLAFGQPADPAGPAAKLKSMIDATSLDSPDAGSWHWKMEITVYDENGKHPELVMTLKGTQQTTLRVGDQLYRSDHNGANLAVLDAVFTQVLNPIPSVVLDAAVKTRLVEKKAGNINLGCVLATIPSPGQRTYSAEVGFCGITGGSHFVAAYEADGTSLTMGQLGSWGSKQVPVSFQISTSGHRKAEGRTTIFAPFSPAPDEFAVTPELHSLELPLREPSAAFLMLSHEQVHSPAGAARGDQGQATFEIVVGENGRMASFKIMKSDDSKFDRTCEEILNHLVLHPYLINGIPVPIELRFEMEYTPHIAVGTPDFDTAEKSYSSARSLRYLALV